MDISNQSDLELLSAYLDDALTADELPRVERWLAEDSHALTYLNDLRSNRSSLKAVAALAPASRRRDAVARSLAERVIETAHSAEIAQSLSPGHHLNLDAGVASEQAAVRLDQSTSSRRAIQRGVTWTGIAALAASIGYFALMPFFTRPSIEPFATAPKGQLTQPAETTETLANNVPAEANESNIEPKSSVPVAGLSVGRGSESPDQLHMSPDAIGLRLGIIIDVVLRTAAWESGKFDELLAKNEIRFENDLVMPKKKLESLIESQVHVGPEPSTDKNDVAMLYVQCSIKTAERLILTLESDSANYFNVQQQFTMAADRDYDSLMKALRGKEISASSGSGFARMIMPEGQFNSIGNIVPAFSLSKRNQAPGLPVGKLSMLLGGGPTSNVEQEATEVIFILRKE